MIAEPTAGRLEYRSWPTGFQVAALIGPHLDRTRERAAHLRIGWATSLDAVCDSDALIIATPPETHHPFAMGAIAAGKQIDIVR